MTDIDKELEEAILEYLSGIDADFGYAVGNLNMDTTPNSRKEIIGGLEDLIKAANLNLLSRIKEEGPRLDNIVSKEYNDGFADACMKWRTAIDNIAKEIRGES